MDNIYIDKALALLEPYPTHYASAKKGLEKLEDAKISLSDFVELLNELADSLSDSNPTLPVEMRFLAVSIMETEFQKMQNVVSIVDKMGS